MKNKIIITLFLIFITLTSCNKDGDYYYIIQMKNGEKIPAFSASLEGGGLDIYPPWDTGNYYSLSSNEFTRVNYVGLKNIYEK